MGIAEILFVLHPLKKCVFNHAYKIIKGYILRREILKMDAAHIWRNVIRNDSF